MIRINTCSASTGACRSTTAPFSLPAGELPHQIVLFQRDLEDCCPDREELSLQISLTLIHEIGHYLGLDEDELQELERQAEAAMALEADRRFPLTVSRSTALPISDS